MRRRSFACARVDPRHLFCQFDDALGVDILLMLMADKTHGPRESHSSAMLRNIGSTMCTQRDIKMFIIIQGVSNRKEITSTSLPKFHYLPIPMPNSRFGTYYNFFP